MPDMEKLDEALSLAGSQWRDEDLDEIMALLGEEPRAPQLPRELVEEEEPRQTQELPEEEELFDRSSWQEPSREERTGRQPMELPDLRNLISVEDEHQTPAGAAAIPELKLGEPEEQKENCLPELTEEFVPPEPHSVGAGEQPDFSDTPVKKQKPWVLAVLGLVAAAEIAALIFILMWWQQWIL